MIINMKYKNNSAKKKKKKKSSELRHAIMLKSNNQYLEIDFSQERLLS